MIIHSIVPIEQIFEGFDQIRDELEEIQMDGLIIQVLPINSRQAKIVRLISPNPHDYLNPKYAPGEMIDYHLQTNG